MVILVPRFLILYITVELIYYSSLTAISGLITTYLLNSTNDKDANDKGKITTLELLTKDKKKS